MAIQQNVSSIPMKDAVAARWFSYFGFEAWFWQPWRPPLVGTPLELRRQGWQRLGVDLLPLYDCLISQLADVRQRGGVRPEEYWVHGEDLAFAETYHSGVGFLLPPALSRWLSSSSAQMLEICNPYPPSSLGRIGWVLSGHQYREHPATSLPSEMQLVLHQLETDLRTLHADPDEETLFTYRMICSAPAIWATYQERLVIQRDLFRAQLEVYPPSLLHFVPKRLLPSSLRIVQLQLYKVEQKLTLLDQASQQIAALSKLAAQRDWEQFQQNDPLWQRIRERVRQLSAAYSHMATASSDQETVPTLHSTPAVQEAPLTPEDWLNQQHSRAAVLSDPVSQALLTALRDSAAWIWNAEQGYAQCIFPLQTPTGNATLDLHLAPELETGGSNAQIEAWLRLMGDHLLDTWLAVQMLLLALTDEFTTPLEGLSVDHILAVCLREKSHGSYTFALRQRVSQELDLLAHLHLGLTIRLHAHHFPVTPMHSPLLSWQEETGHRATVNLGDWVRQIPGQWRASVELPRFLLKLHTRNERSAKRIGLQVLFLLSEHPKGVTMKMRELLEQSHVRIDDPNQKRFRDQITADMKLLTGLVRRAAGDKRQKSIDEELIWDTKEAPRQAPLEEQIIGDYSEIGEDEKKRALVRQTDNNWYETWLSFRWRFLPLHMRSGS